MKTGFGEYDDDYEAHAMQLLGNFAEKAKSDAYYYAQAANRTKMSSMDMVIALQYQAHQFPYTPIHNNASHDTSEDTNNTISEDTSSEDTNSEDEFDDEFTRADSQHSEKIRLMNYYHDNWESYKPTEYIDTIIYNAINKALESVK